MSKVIVIGSGLGGLSCGYILQKNGFEVSVLEQGLQAGGCLQCFTRKGVRFETGMHFIGSALPGQTMDTMMRYLGMEDRVKLSPMDPKAYNIVSLDSQEFRFPVGREAFIEQMGEYFPSQKDALRRYVDIVDKIAAASALSSLCSQDRDMAANTQYQLLPINGVLDSLFSDPLLRNVLAGDLPLYSGEKDKTPFTQQAFIFDFYNQSSFRLEGGSDSIAKSLVSGIREMGGEVLTGKKVVKILCDEQKATAVQTEDESLYKADWIISTIHPSRLMELLQDTKLIRPAFRNRINSIPQTSGVFAVYLKFKEGRMPYLNSNYFGYKGSSPWDCEHYSLGEWPKGFLYMHMCHERQPLWAKSAVVLSYMNMAEVEAWKGTRIGHRGEDYERFKRERAEILLAELERQRPGTLECVEDWWTSTPLTYLDYTGTEKGSMYGVAKDINAGAAGRVPYRTKVPNLLLAGQNVNSHGMLGVIVGTVVTCAELVPAATLYSQINKYR